VPTYQRKDHFHQRAQREGFRSRAAYKLLEIQKAHRLLRKGQRVADLGCWPGSWMQVAAQQVGPGGRVVGIDLAAVEPPLGIDNAIALCGDLSDPEIVDRLLAALGGPAHVVLSDAAPKLTGIRDTDRAHEETLLHAIESLLPRLLRPDGSLLLKLLESPEAQASVQRLRVRFQRARSVKTAATRPGSTERYLLASGYRPEID
jgi:23S rRNA (uridine2552-2'-O)-methyltransferase